MPPRTAWLALLGLFVLTSSGHAQSTYPSRPVRIVVPSPPAGGTDIIARVLAQYFSAAMGQQFFVENRPGAGNMIGIDSVARAAPDGYTLLFVPSTLALNSVMYKKVSYDPVRDFAPITLAAAANNVLVVNPTVPAKTLIELVALAKQKPGQLTYGTPGIGTSPHMSMELLKSLAGIDLQHIPYRGTAPAMTDVISGQINAMFASGGFSFIKLDDCPQPAKTFVFIEGFTKNAILFGAFGPPIYPSNLFASRPGMNHFDTDNRAVGTGISFADGHAIFWRYSDRRTGDRSTPFTPNSPDVYQLEAWSGGPVPPGVAQ